MMASVPSSTALATSLASARVGRGLRIIESSICVAVITGLAAM
jgi:putative Mn2+ efflux pump MntP